MKALQLVAITVLSIFAVGCGSEVKVPDGSIVAGYIDLEKTENVALELAEKFIDTLPKAEKQFQLDVFNAAKKQVETFRDEIDAKWLMFASGVGAGYKNVKAEEVYIVIRHNANEEKLKAFLDSLQDGKADGMDVKILPVGDLLAATPRAFRRNAPNISSLKMTNIDGKYLVAGNTDKAFKAIYSLYRSGEGASDSFCNLGDLEDDSVLQIKTVEVRKVFDSVKELQTAAEEFAKACGDEDFVDCLASFKDVTFNLIATEDDIGATFSVDAGSSDGADVFESLFILAKFASRVAVNTGMAVGGKLLPVDDLKEYAEILRDAFEIDRSGNVNIISFILDVDDCLEIAKDINNPKEKESK